MLDKIKAWLLANPVIEHLLEVFVWGIVGSVVYYVKNGMASNTQLTLSGLGVAVGVFVKMFYATNRATIAAWAQDFLEKQAPAPITPTVTAASSSNGVPAPKSAAMTLIKMVLLLVGFSFLFVSSALADGWNFPKGQMKLELKQGLSIGDVVSVSQDVLALAPYVDGLYKFSADTPAGSGGLGFHEAFGIFRVSPNADGTTNVNPQLFIGIGVVMYPGNFLQNQLSGAIPFDLGVELGLPTIQGVGSFTLGYDLSDQKVTVSGTAPLDVIGGKLISVIKTL